MVRFARADGSKGSNKRVLEEPTPWTEMVPREKMSKKRKEEAAGEATVEAGFNKVKRKTLWQEESPACGDEKDVSVTPESQEKPGNIELNNSSEGGKRKKRGKKKKDKSLNKSQPEYTINEKGQRVKVFKNGKERTWFDLPYEESDRMTRYDNMWVKCEMVAKLDQLRASLKEQELSPEEVSEFLFSFQ